MAATLPYLELKFRPNVMLITIVRRFVSDFYDQFLNDLDATSRVALATHELLENAVRYSTDGETTVRIAVERGEDLDRLSLLTTNRTSPEHIATAREILEEVKRQSDRLGYFQTVLHRNMRRRVGSGLGLARVFAEAEMSLDYDIAGDVITIRAETQVKTRTAP